MFGGSAVQVGVWKKFNDFDLPFQLLQNGICGTLSTNKTDVKKDYAVCI